MQNTKQDGSIRLSARRRILSGILKCIVVVSAALGVILSVMASGDNFMSGSRTFMYFTIQSNIAMALICLIGGLLMISGHGVGDAWHIVRFMGTVSITLTGAVFCFVLAPTLGERAWKAHNVLTHVVVPLAAIADFFVAGITGNLKRRCVFFGILPPLAYAIYAGIGYVAGWEFSDGVNYPYFFLNWGSPAGAFGFMKGLPFMGCVWWIAALLILLLLVGLVYLTLLDRLKKHAGKAR